MLIASSLLFSGYLKRFSRRYFSKIAELFVADFLVFFSVFLSAIFSLQLSALAASLSFGTPGERRSNLLQYTTLLRNSAV